MTKKTKIIDSTSNSRHPKSSGRDSSQASSESPRTLPSDYGLAQFFLRPQDRPLFEPPMVTQTDDRKSMEWAEMSPPSVQTEEVPKYGADEEVLQEMDAFLASEDLAEVFSDTDDDDGKEDVSEPETVEGPLAATEDEPSEVEASTPTPKKVAFADSMPQPPTPPALPEQAQPQISNFLPSCILGIWVDPRAPPDVCGWRKTVVRDMLEQRGLLVHNKETDEQLAEQRKKRKEKRKKKKLSQTANPW